MSATDSQEATPETIDEVRQEVMRCYEKRGEELIETLNGMSDQTIDLLEKTLGVHQATSVPDVQRRVQDLIESSLSALRVNVQSALSTNAAIIASSKELADRFSTAVKARHDQDRTSKRAWRSHTDR
jgi:hypothetical protein